jgi:hypothetical protein
LGFLTMMMIFAHAIGACLGMLRKSAPPRDVFLTRVVLASLLGVLANSFFIDTLHWRHLWYLLALGAGLAPSMDRSSSTK